jgi:hypothetical protein
MIKRRRETGGPMFIRVRDSHFRSILKAVSWRITGSIDTFVLSFIFTGSVKVRSPALKRSRKLSSTIFTKELGPSFAGISKDKLVADPGRPDSTIQAANVTRLAR